MSRREPAAVVDGAALNKPNVESAPQQDQQGDGARLLHDIIAGFDQRKADRFRATVPIENLSASGDRRQSWESGRDAQRLARLLRPLHIRAMTIRFVDGTAKGYLRRSFEEALIRCAEVRGTGTGLS